MSGLAWLLVVVAGVLAFLLLLLVGLLSSSLTLRGRVDERGVDGGVRWFGVGVDIDGHGRRVEVRLLGRRVARRPLANGTKTERGRGRRARRRPDRARPKRRPWSRGRLSLGAYRRLARAGLHEVARLQRIVHVDRLRLDAVVACEDPALAGELYGYGTALTAVARQAWPAADLRVGVDFLDTRPRGTAELAVRVRPIRAVGSGARLAFAYLRERRRSRRAV